jgi:tetratricopeptide (TPR) repeat protein
MAADSVSERARTREVVLDPDELARLEEEREFLQRSIDDLDRELAAGDLDAADHAALGDGYRRRLDETVAAIDAGRIDVPVSSGRWHRVAVAAGVVVVALLAGLLVAQASGRRDPGEGATGDIRETVRGRIAAADRLLAAGDTDAAIEAYDDVLADEPANAQALTYKGWAQVLAGRADDGLLTLIDAAEADPEYPDVHAFLAIVFERLGRLDTALAELDRLDELDAPPAMRDLTAGLRARIEAALATSTSTTTTTTSG